MSASKLLMMAGASSYRSDHSATGISYGSPGSEMLFEYIDSTLSGGPVGSVSPVLAFAGSSKEVKIMRLRQLESTFTIDLEGNLPANYFSHMVSLSTGNIVGPMKLLTHSYIGAENVTRWSRALSGVYFFSDADITPTQSFYLVA